MDVIRTYIGNEEYIAAGFCKENQEKAFQLIAELDRAGYRVWFARENDFGNEAEKSRLERIGKCSLYLALFTEDALNSHDFRRDLNMAMKEHCRIVSVELEPINGWSMGMKAQWDMTEKLMLWEKPEQSLLTLMQKRGMLKEELKETAVGEEKKEAEFYLFREKNGEHIALTKKKNMLGRSDKLCQYVIQDNCTVGREHAIILASDQLCKLVDNHSYNGTFLNGQRLEPGKAYVLKHGDRIVLSNEEFIFQTVNKEMQ